MKNLTIGMKLFVGFSILVFLTTLLGFISYRGITLLDKAFDDIDSESVPSTKAINNIQLAFKGIRVLHQKYLFNEVLLTEKNAPNSVCYTCHSGLEVNLNQNSLLSAIEIERKNLEENWIKYENINQDSVKTSSLWQGLVSDFDAFKKDLNDLMMIAKGNTSEADKYIELHTLSKALEPTEERINKSLNTLSDLNASTTKKSLNESIETISSVKLSIIIIIIVAIMISIIVGLYLSIKTIKEPLKNLVSIFELVTQDDLRSKVDVRSKDEFGVLAEKVNAMIDSRRNNILDLMNKSETINKSSDTLLEISNNIENSSEDLVAQTNNAASSSEQISANVQTVSSAAEEMTSSIKEISKNTSSASGISDEAQRKAYDANSVMNRLGVSSGEIGSILKVITSIAEQTNLLALNATIEAARAGELGKGFAVVANEVKDLAKESAKATETISQRIIIIQEDSKNAMNVIKEITEINQKVNDITNTISSAVEEQTATVGEVNRNLNDASVGVSSIAEITSNISSSANKFSKSAHKLKVAASELKQISKSLEEELLKNYRL